jgi:hypothetical protein
MFPLGVLGGSHETITVVPLKELACRSWTTLGVPMRCMVIIMGRKVGERTLRINLQDL